MAAIQYMFLDYMDVLQFVRSDAVDDEIVEHEMLLRATYPYDPDRVIERGMKVFFNDGEDMRYFEVRQVVPSAITLTQEIEAEELCLTELTDSMVSALSVSKANWNDVVTDLLTTTAWTVGDTLVTMPADEVTYSLYKVSTGSSAKLTLRSAPSTTSKALGYYANNTQVKQISNYNTTWKKVEVGDKTGYMSRSYLTFYRTVTIPGLPKITMKAAYRDRYSVMVDVLKTVGLRPSPRIVRSGSELARYVDFDAIATDVFRGARIEIDRAAYADQIVYSDRGLYTRVCPTGKDGLTISSITWSVVAGNPGSSPYGYDWVEDPNATDLYGRQGVYPRTCHIEFSDIDNATDLINAAWAYLQTVNKPTVSITLSALDIGALGYGSGARLKLGERVNVIIQPLGILLQLNVVELTRNLSNPENTVITIGAFAEDSVSQAVSTAQAVENLTDTVNDMPARVLDWVYPVGAIYMSATSTSPATFLGGTWTQIKDRFLLAKGDTYSNGDTGGAATHKHLGTSGYSGSTQGTIWTNGTATGTVDGYKTNGDANTGGSTPDITVPYTGNASSLPPYLVVYMWKRTA